MEVLADQLVRIEEAYSTIVTKGDVEAARSELRLHLREHVVWERNTVWREMIGIERKAQAANLGIRNTMLGQDTDPKKARLQGDDAGGTMKEVHTPVGRYTCPKFLVSGTFWILIAIIAIFTVLLVVPIMEKGEQQNCLALVVFVSLLWATEVTNKAMAIATMFLTDHIIGDPSLRYFASGSFPRGYTTSCTTGCQTPFSPRQQASRQLCFCCDVDACYHALARRFHHCRCT